MTEEMPPHHKKMTKEELSAEVVRLQSALTERDNKIIQLMRDEKTWRTNYIRAEVELELAYEEAEHVRKRYVDRMVYDQMLEKGLIRKW